MSAEADEIKPVVFLSDELFPKSVPILISVILRIELADSRKAGDWKEHWKTMADENCGGFVTDLRERLF